MVAQQTKQITDLPRTRSDSYVDVYSNQCYVRFGSHDITILCARIREVEPGQSSVEEQASITMAPSQFKAFLNVSAETLKAYEMLFGKLSAPEEITKSSRVAEEIVAAVRGSRESANASST